MINYGKQSISKEDIDSVIDVLKSDFLTQGPKVGEFETQLSNFSGSKHAIAVNSATSALHIACLALGLGAGDIMWTTPISFVASANCGLYCGATIDFVDINSVTNNICTDALETKLKKSALIGKLPKVLVVVHLSGLPADMAEIHRLAKTYNVKIVEDASHAIGAKYMNTKIGSCAYSDITVFSFHPVKIITTGEGGAALTNDLELSQKMRKFASHGITKEPTNFINKQDGPWYYEQQQLGFNYRMSDIHAALGISQLKRIDELIIKRNEIAKYYDDNLTKNAIDLPCRLKNILSSFHLYIIRVHAGAKKSRNELFVELHNADIFVNLHYIPIYRQPYYLTKNYNMNDYPNAELYYKQAISLPIYPDLKKGEIDYVIDTINGFLE